MKISFIPFPELYTERLALKQLMLDDEYELYALRTNGRVNEFLDREPPQSVEEVAAFIEKVNDKISRSEYLIWSICLKNDPKLIGTICLWNFSEDYLQTEVGYELHPEFYGRGIMQEALAKVMEFGFKTMQVKTIEAFTKPGNQSSIRLLERNNFRRGPEAESRIRNAGGMVIYSISSAVYGSGRA